MNLDEIKRFEADVQGLPLHEKAIAKQLFFQQRIKGSPEWAQAPPDARFQFARAFGIDIGHAQQYPGEAFRQGGKPVTGEFGEGPFATGFLPEPPGGVGNLNTMGEAGRLGEDLNKVEGVADLAYRAVPFGGLGMGLAGLDTSDLGTSRYPSSLLENLGDPTQAMQGGAAALTGKVPWLGQWLAKSIQNPLIRKQLEQGVLSSMMDNQFLGLHRVPGWAAGKAGNFLQRFRSGGSPVQPPSTFSQPQGVLPAGQPMRALPAQGTPAKGPFPMPGAVRPPEMPERPFKFVR